MTKHHALSSGNLVYQGEDNRPHVIPPGECEVEQNPADNSYILRWEEAGAPRTARFSAMQYFDFVRTKRLLVRSKRASSSPRPR